MSNEWKIDVDGVTKDFDTDFGFKVKSWPGTGHSPVANRATPYALQDGAFFTGQRMTARTFTLLGTFYGSTTLAAFHTQRQALIKALSSRTTTINNRPATVTITYTGAAVDKEIYVVYEGGLELATFETNIENDVPIRLTAYDPSWKATSDTVTALATTNTLTLNRITSLVESNWVAMGSGANGIVNTTAIAENGDFYIGGAFTSPSNEIAKWNGSSWSGLSSGLTGGGANVYAMKFVANGDLYVGGSFVQAGAVVSPYIIKWDGSVWSDIVAFSGAGGGDVYSLAVDSDDLIYIGGSSAGVNGNIHTWDGSTITLHTVANTLIRSIAFSPIGNLYAAGAFTTIGGVSANYIAKYNGAAWVALGTGANATVRTIAFSSIGELYAGGDFTTIGGVSANYIAKWSGTAWVALGAGLGAACYTIDIDTNGTIAAGGNFTTAGGNPVYYMAKWDGASWEQYPIQLNGAVNSISFDNGDMNVGGAFSGSIVSEGVTTSAYAGTEIAYPVITINRSGGTTANIVSVVNTLTNASISMDYDLLDGETLTIDLRPGQRTVTSSFYGLRWNAILDNSDFASWFLQPDNTAGATDNTITAYVITTGSPTITTNMTYRTAYRSLD